MHARPPGIGLVRVEYLSRNSSPDIESAPSKVVSRKFLVGSQPNASPQFTQIGVPSA